MTLPKLSVVIPNYNHARFLPICLDAILEQSVPADEIIILDDASTDHSLEVIEAYAAKHPVIRVVRNEQNRGVVYGMNRGLELARNEYIYFAAADDQALPGLFEKSLRLLARNPQAALSCTIGDWREVESGLNWHVGVGMAPEPCYLGPDELVELERRGILFIASHTAIMRRQVIIEAGRFIPELKMHCDWFAMYVSSFRYGICFVPEPLGISNIHAASFYTRGVREREAYRQVLNRMLEYLVQPDYADAAAKVRQSGALFLFGKPMLKLLISEARFRRFLTPIFLRKNVWHILKVTAKRFTPGWVAELYFRLAGYRAR